MADSIREKIVQSVLSLAQTITKDNGYETDIGLHMERARRSFSGCDLPGGAVWANGEASARDYASTQQVMDIAIDGHHELVKNETSDVTANRMLADFRKAVETYDSTLNALVSGIQYTQADPEYPDDGSSAVSVTVKYEITYDTARGDPHTQP